jgi:hypothetical protein
MNNPNGTDRTPAPRGEIKVTFGVELVVYANGRKKKIADWKDCPPEVWNGVLKEIIQLRAQSND